MRLDTSEIFPMHFKAKRVPPDPQGAPSLSLESFLTSTQTKQGDGGEKGTGPMDSHLSFHPNLITDREHGFGRFSLLKTGALDYDSKCFPPQILRF